MQLHTLGITALLMTSACSSPPINAAFVDLPGLDVIALPDSVGGPLNLRIVNSTNRTITMQPPPCSTAIQKLFGETWVTVLERAEVCAGFVVILEPDQEFGYFAEMPDATGWLRAELLIVDGGDSYVVRTRAFLVTAGS